MIAFINKKNIRQDGDKAPLCLIFRDDQTKCDFTRRLRRDNTLTISMAFSSNVFIAIEDEIYKSFQAHIQFTDIEQKAKCIINLENMPPSDDFRLYLEYPKGLDGRRLLNGFRKAYSKYLEAIRK